MRILKHLTLSAPNPLRTRRQPSPGGILQAHVPRPAFPLRTVSWAALAAALAGCDGSNSVVHSAVLEAKPDMLCMKQALERLPGVSGVAYVHETQGQNEFEELTYQTGGQRVMLMVQPNREYRHTFLRLGSSDEATPRIRRVMGQVDATLEQSCHIRHLSRRIRETCPDAAHPDGKCPPLAPDPMHEARLP